MIPEKSIPGTTAYFKIRAMTRPWRVIQGGQAAGKNWGIEQNLMELATEKQRTITIVTDTFENLRDGVIKDYRDMFNMMERDFDLYYNSATKDLTWGSSLIQFRYVVGHKQQAGKSKRREILYVNETTKIPWLAIEPYIARTSEICFFDLNPDFETWTHTKIEPDEKAEKIILTHWDNERCPAAEREFIESRKDDIEWYRVYGLGETGTYSDRRIYKFTIVPEVPGSAQKINSGMDFGVSPDPTCLVDLYLDGPNLYIDELFTENNLLPKKITGAEQMAIVDKMDEIGFPKGWMICCDESGETEIKDLVKHRYNAKGVKKGPGSVIEGIKKVRSYKLHITKRSEKVKKGFESWFWKVDHNGKIIPEPQGHEPDGCAAARYGVMGHTAIPKPVKMSYSY